MFREGDEVADLTDPATVGVVTGTDTAGRLLVSWDMGSDTCKAVDASRLFRVRAAQAQPPRAVTTEPATGTPEPVTGTTEDPRIEALLQLFREVGRDMREGGVLTGPADWEWLIALAVRRLDAADAAAGIRRVDEWDEKCFGCHQYYNAEGVRCYIDNERASHCLAAASERVGGAS